MIKNPYEIEVMLLAVMSCKPPHRDEEGYGTSVTCETALPRHEDLLESLPAGKIIVRLVEEAMSETGTNDRSYQKSIKKRIQKTFRHTFPSEEASEDVPSEDESRDEKD